MSLKTVSVAAVQGEDVSLHDLLSNLKIKGRLRPLISEAVLDKVIAHAVKHEGIQVGTEELQQAADAFRVRRGLHKAADLERWLARTELTPEDFEVGLERDLQTRKLADKVVTQEQVDKFFAENRTRFDRARLAHLVVEKEGLANELLSQLRDDGADFADMARKHSLDERTKPTGGRLGISPANGSSPPWSRPCSTPKRATVVGPFKTNGAMHLLKVEELFRASSTRERPPRSAACCSASGCASRPGGQGGSQAPGPLKPVYAGRKGRSHSMSGVLTRTVREQSLLLNEESCFLARKPLAKPTSPGHNQTH